MELELTRGREKANQIKKELYFRVLRFCESKGDAPDLYAAAALAELAAECGVYAVGPRRTKDLLLQLALTLPGSPEPYDPPRDPHADRIGRRSDKRIAKIP